MQLDLSDRKIYRKYAKLPLPRHTSYPAVPFWGRYSEEEFRRALNRSNQSGRDLSLYVHVPFCEQLCYYCTCTKEVVPKRAGGGWRELSTAYLGRLEHELTRVAGAVDTRRVVRQIHLGGGTPTYLTSDQLVTLATLLLERFYLAPDAEVSVELDPRVTTWDRLHTLRELGFNRISLGVQDFDPGVQAAVNRIQSSDLVMEFTGKCRRLGFRSVNFDLIYGLPFQTPESVARTVRKTIALGPDRVAFYRMAVIPELFRWQKAFKPEDLPTSDATLEMFLNAIEAFQTAGYRFIGLDHFAKPDDPLAQAQDQGMLRRTFQGMTTGAGLDVLGFGPSAASILSDAYAQNAKPLADWSEAINAGRLATFRGMNLSSEDLIRQVVLGQLYCNAEIDKRQIEEQFALSFDDHFADELRRLTDLERDGLVQLAGSRICLTYPLGRLLLRVIAAVFDAYLPHDAYRKAQSTLVASKVG